ncbi:MAG TPA: S41 family peptidase [bacterium]|nr:S41 family peptidase [bacterium]HQL62254.1 S41 family peptidase [bacterium]
MMTRHPFRRLTFTGACFLLLFIQSTWAVDGSTEDPRFQINLREYDIGQKNFNRIVHCIRDRYESEQVDLKKVFAHALYSAEQVVREVEGAGAVIVLATSEPPYSLQELEYVQRLGNLIAGRIRSASATVASVTQLWNAALTSMVNALEDPYSQYLPPQSYGDLQQFLSGEGIPENRFFGVGIRIEWDVTNNAGLFVRSPIPGTPAAISGIKTGDIIVAVDGIPLSATGTPVENLNAAVERIKGPEGTKVKLTVIRPGSGPFPLHFELTREPMRTDQLIWAEMLGEETGHLTLLSFYQRCSEDVEKNLLKLRQQGMKKLILDLRSNPGGFLDEAIKVADIFLPQGTLITYTQGRTEDTRKDFFDQRTGDENFTQIPIVILVDSRSASASEVVTGALKDQGRAQVVGVKTFGKGSVQELFPLEGDAGLRLTVAKYYTPNGRCIHNQGIEPDVAVEYEPPQIALPDENSESRKDTGPKPVTASSLLEKQLATDNQLRAAYQLLNRNAISTK